ncbi:MAG TPA: cytochrome c oxidase assembly protein [Terrimicrobiaceae bacterium]|nr:cytochrome c oxidase assembly protein [Terrimicrobiaceae bacterium]
MNAESAVLASWAFLPVPAFGLLATALIYLRGWRKLRRQVPARYPPSRLVFFFAGLAAIYLSLASPLDAFASFLLTAHMVQHLLLTMIVPPLLLLGAPQLPLLCGLPRRFVSHGLGPFLQWPLLKNFLHRLMHPAVCWILFILSNILWHLPDFYELALRSPAWHRVEHFCFLATALLFWWHVVQPWPSRPYWPRWAIIPYLLLADIQNTVLAAFLSFYDRVAYPTYANAPRLWLNPMTDQASAGAIMWVPGSIAFILPAALIAVQFLSPKNLVQPSRRGAELRIAKPKIKKFGVRTVPFDFVKVRVLGAMIRSRYFRRTLQVVTLFLAAAIVLDGLLGPKISPMNLAGVLPWTHWRAFTVIGLLAIGNLFCMACPFTFVRDLGRKILPARLRWPRALSSKWLSVGLIVTYLWAYEAFDLWDKPAITALVILGYFLGALLVDGFFRGASFCKFVCPIGQFHFVQSLASPFEVKVRSPEVCASCRTFDCIKGNAAQRGCELQLFQPRKSGNMDCTFCLDCIKACPHDNVGILAVRPGRDLICDLPRSSVRRYAKRPDLAALVLVLTFGAFANAAGMVAPVLSGITQIEKALNFSSDLGIVTLLSVLCLIVLPAALAAAAAACSRVIAGNSLQENLCRFSMSLAPLGFGMWLAHFIFHLFTAALTPIPVAERIAKDLGIRDAEPVWSVSSLAFYNLPGLELLFLDLGFLVALYIGWRIAAQMNLKRRFATFLPWGLLAAALYALGVWIIFQPMEMRGMMMR